MRTLLLPLLAATLPISAAAQDPRSKNLTFAVRENALPEYGALSALDHTTTLTWEASVPHPDGLGGYSLLPAVTASLPFDRPGSCRRLDQATYLVSGYETAAATGHLVRVLLVRETPRFLVVIDQLALPGLDPWEVAWNKHEGRIYLRDFASGQLFALPLANAQAALPAATDLSPALTSTHLPALASGASYAFWSNSRPEPGVVFAPTDPTHAMGTAAQPRFKVAFAPTAGWTVTPYTTRDVSDAAIQARGYAIRQGTFVPTVGPLLIKGPSGPISIRDLDTGQTVWTGTMPVLPGWWATDDDDVSTWHALQFSPGVLVPGHAYRVEGAGLQSRVILPLIRYGRGTSAAEGAHTFSLQRGQLNGWEATLGNPSFRIEGQLVTTPLPSAAQSLAYLVVGLQSPGTAPPIVDYGDGVFLLSGIATWGPRSLTLLDGSERLGLLHTLPIPNDAALVGTTVLFQHAMFFSASTLVSDVFGTTIRP